VLRHAGGRERTLGDRRLEAHVADVHVGSSERDHPLGLAADLLVLVTGKGPERAVGERRSALAVALDPPRSLGASRRRAGC
jgi:hypothetical protein